jgi:hypothetical protein
VENEMREIAQIPALMVLTLVARAPCSAKSIRPLAKVIVLPFAIVAQPIDGASNRVDQQTIVRRLAEEATARAERSLLQQRIAVAVEQLPFPVAGGVSVTAVTSDSRPGGAGAEGPVQLEGTVRLPVSLPAPLTGPRSWFHRGPFATAEVELRRAGGAVIAREAATLDWRDVRWFTGAGRLRRSRPLDEVLIDFARKATDRAIKRLKAHESLFAGP